MFTDFRKDLARRFNFQYLKARWFHEPRAFRHFFEKNPLIQKPLFSVVIPTYNIERVYLQDCLQSLFEQSYPHWELCICDDADPLKESRDYIFEVAKKLPNKVKIISHEKNQGICAATRSALSLAQGDYVVFMDADDVLHSKALECLARSLGKDHVDFIYSDHDYMTDWGLRLHPMLKPGWSPELLLHINYINHLACIRKDLVLQLQEDLFQEETRGAQDWDLCLRMITQAQRVRHVPLILYHWRARPGSMADQPMSKPWAVQNQLEVRRRLASDFGTGVSFDTRTWSYQKKNLQALEKVKIDLSQKSFETWTQLKLLAQESRMQTKIFLFVDERMSLVDENLFHPLGVYAEMSHVGCVWPFLQQGLRTAYTPYGSNILGPVLQARSCYSQYTGNVLTGPLTGLVISSSKFVKMMDWLEAELSSEEFASLFQQEGNQVFGALLGLGSLFCGFRNVSSSQCIYEQQLPSVSLPSSLIPWVDSYL